MAALVIFAEHKTRKIVVVGFIFFGTTCAAQQQRPTILPLFFHANFKLNHLR